MKLRLIGTVALCATSAFAQMKETVNVNVIEVPVSVVDSCGNPVRGLTAANDKRASGAIKVIVQP